MFHRRIRDGVLNKLVLGWLKAGVFHEEAVTISDTGTPQGGNVSVEGDVRLRINTTGRQITESIDVDGKRERVVFLVAEVDDQSSGRSGRLPWLHWLSQSLLAAI